MTIPFLRRSLLLLTLITTSAWASESAPSADRDWAALEQTLRGGGEDPPDGTPGDRFLAIFRNITDYLREAETFRERYPDDPRRWDALLNMKDFYVAALNMLERQDDATKARVDAVLPAAERAAWSARLEKLEAEFLAATDVAPATRYRRDVEPWFNSMFELMNKKLPEAAPAWAELRAGLDRLAAAYPDLPDAGQLVKHYTGVRFSSGKDSPLRRAELVSLGESPNRHIRTAAQEQIQFLDLAREPIELAFTAADGREVDLADLRGKVVLIDFWATWCAPCIEEIPTIKRVYETYHEQGFEVIGITLENPRFTPNDSDEKKQEKLETARRRMLAFVQDRGMPWPQYFDGKWWKNDIARRYAIESIPAMFLLDQEGRLVSTNARGERLEAEVRRLLKL